MKNLGKIGDPEDLVTKKYVDDLFSGGGRMQRILS